MGTSLHEPEQAERTTGQSRLQFGIVTALSWTAAVALYLGALTFLDFPRPSGYWILAVWVGVAVVMRLLAGRIWAACASVLICVTFGTTAIAIYGIANPVSSADYLRAAIIGAVLGLLPVALAELLLLGLGCGRRNRVGSCWAIVLALGGTVLALILSVYIVRESSSATQHAAAAARVAAERDRPSAD